MKALTATTRVVSLIVAIFFAWATPVLAHARSPVAPVGPIGPAGP